MSARLYGIAIAMAFGVASTAAGQTQPESEAKQSKENPEVERPSLRFGNDTIRLDLRARFQLDARHPNAPGDDDARALDVARKRIGIHGALAKAVAFQVEAELDDDDPWRDVYVDYRQFDALRLRAGQFKLPFSLDENTSATDLDFVYRSSAARQLAPGRDLGVMLHGRLWQRVLRYEVGVFSNDGDHTELAGDLAAPSSRTTVVRVTAAPFGRSHAALKSLRAAAAFTVGDLQEGVSGVRGRTILGSRFFPSGFWVQGERRRTGVEVQWRRRAFSLAAEYMRLQDERRNQALDGSDLSPLLGSGWYVSGTSARARAGRFGLLELAARVEGIRFGSNGPLDRASMSPRAERIATMTNQTETLGINWYVNRWIKVQGNLIHDRSDGTTGLTTQAPSWGRVLRVQLAL